MLGSAVTFAVNVVAGYWRAYAKTVGSRLEWFLAVHSPVPLVALLRRAAGVTLSGEGLAALAVFVAAYFLGQRVGGMLHGSVRSRLGEAGRLVFTDILRLRAAAGQPA